MAKKKITSIYEKSLLEFKPEFQLKFSDIQYIASLMEQLQRLDIEAQKINQLSAISRIDFSNYHNSQPIYTKAISKKALEAVKEIVLEDMRDDFESIFKELEIRGVSVLTEDEAEDNETNPL